MDNINNTLQNYEQRLQALEEKFNNHHAPRIDKFIFLHKELMKLANKKVSKDDVYLILKKIYNLATTTFHYLWVRLSKLDNHFKFTDNKDDKHAFLVTHESTRAFIQPLDAIYK